MKVLFICSSNICRSPYCEYVFRRMVAEDPVLSANVEWVKSAAVINRMKTIHPKAKLALLREGFSASEIDAHRPRYKRDDPVTFAEADVIIGMTRGHRFFTPRRFRNKVVMLSEAATGRYTPIPDPFLKKDIEGYYAVMDEIKRYLERYAERLRQEVLSADRKQHG